MRQLNLKDTDRSVDTSRYSYRESFRSTMKIVNDRFLTSITVTVGESLVRKYQLSYKLLNFDKGVTISCLEKVQEYGRTENDYFPAIILGYSENNLSWDVRTDIFIPPTEVRFIDMAGGGNVARDLGTRIMDINGDGISDLVRNDDDSPPIEKVYLGTGEGFEILTGSNFPYDFQFTSDYKDRGVRIADVNNDSLPDLALNYIRDVYVNGSTELWHDHVTAVNTGNSFEYSLGSDYSILPSEFPFIYSNIDSEIKELGTRFIDFNGDGYPDLMRHAIGSSIGGEVFFIAKNTGSGFSMLEGSDASVYQPPSRFGFALNDNGNGTQIIDYNGDGLPEIVKYNEICVYNNGTGFSPTSDVIIPSSLETPFINADHQDEGTRIFDINGDGLPDLIRNIAEYSSGTLQRIGVNTGKGFQSTTGISLPPDVVFEKVMSESPSIQVDQGTRVIDVNGDGLSDLLNHAGFTSGPKVAINKGSAPNLLTSIDNGIGGKVEIEYSLQTKGFMKLYDPATEELEVNGHIPYVMQVVSRITRTTGSDTYSTLYRYSNGKFLDREFRGFGKVKTIDAQTGNFSITEFHQDYSRKGQVKSVRSYVGDRRDYRVGSVINGEFKTASEEAAPSNAAPKIVQESYTRYRIIIHEDDPNHLKTYTDTNTKLGLVDFPKGMTLSTPACTITKTYEYSGDYTLPSDSVPHLITAQDLFYDGRGNLLQSINYGKVMPINDDLSQPSIDTTFIDDFGAQADGRFVVMTKYQQMGNWMDVPMLLNTSGFYTADFNTGARETVQTRTLQAKKIECDSFGRPTRITHSLNTGPDPVSLYSYDQFGNITKTTDPKNNSTIISYESISHIFPETVTNAMGHVESFTFGSRIWQSVDPYGCKWPHTIGGI